MKGQLRKLLEKNKIGCLRMGDDVIQSVIGNYVQLIFGSYWWEFKFPQMEPCWRHKWRTNNLFPLFYHQNWIWIERNVANINYDVCHFASGGALINAFTFNENCVQSISVVIFRRNLKAMQISRVHCPWRYKKKTQNNKIKLAPQRQQIVMCAKCANNFLLLFYFPNCQ